MKIRTVLTLILVFVFSVALGLAEAPVHWTVTGSIHFLGTDLDYGIAEGIMGICAGKGTLGEHSCNTMIMTGTASSTLHCEGEDILLMFTHVQRFKNGDLLYSKIAPSLGDNYLCKSNGEYWGAVTTEFVGGTGRFEEASGYANWIFRGDVLETHPVFFGKTFYASACNEVRGTLFLDGD